MAPLFDQDAHQDSAPSPQDRPVPGAGAATLGQGDLASTQEPEEERPEQRDAVDPDRAEPEGSESIGPEIDGRDENGESGAPAGGRVDPDPEPAPSLEGEPVAAGEPTPAAPADLDHAPDPPTDDITAPPAHHLPPPPSTLPPRPSEPGASVTHVVSAAPSSAGPAPSRIEPPRLAPVRLGRQLASRLRLLVRWPAPVRATPDQRASSLVMLFVLAVTVGVVGAAILAGLAFLIISTLGHGSGG